MAITKSACEIELEDYCTGCEHLEMQILTYTDSPDVLIPRFACVYAAICARVAKKGGINNEQ